MHIALYTPGWPLEKFHNGIVTFVHWMRIEFERLGHKVSVFTSQLDGKPLDPNVHLVQSSRFDKVASKLRRYYGSDEFGIKSHGREIGRAMRAVHRKDKIDIIEMEESFGWSWDVQAITGLPVLVKLHGPAFESLTQDELVTPLSQKRIVREGEALARARAIAAPSADTLAKTLARYSLHPVIKEHIVNPLETERAIPLWSPRSSNSDQILFVGRFDKRKGGDVALDAFALLAKKRPQLSLVFVGPDNGVTQVDGGILHFEKYCLGHLQDSVRCRVDYRGRLPNHDIPELRGAARVVWVPSLWESQGYTAVEALCQGCPVVASDTGGLRESVIDEITGLLSIPGDPFSLADQTARLLDDVELAARLGAEGRRRVLAVHGTRQVAEQSLKLYERVIADAKTGR